LQLFFLECHALARNAIGEEIEVLTAYGPFRKDLKDEDREVD
jgi:hypothetical protein